MCTETLTFDGHEYTIERDAQSRTAIIRTAPAGELVGTIAESPCGEYLVAEPAPDYNPLGMGTQHHINSTTLDELVPSLIASTY